jgi:hypothetical protein
VQRIFPGLSGQQQSLNMVAYEKRKVKGSSATFTVFFPAKK